MIFNEAFYTVLSGVTVYTFGQILSKFFIDPIQKQKETFGKISDALIYYANLYTDPITSENLITKRDKERDEASDKFRNLACELISRTHQIPCYKFLSCIKLVPSIKIITDSRGSLIGLSNGMYPNHNSIEYNDKRRKELEMNLNLITE